MNGFERRKEQSKEDIRRAAEELFSRFGAERVSVSDIARRAGVSQATIYNNFGSKDNLVQDYRKSVVGALASRFRGILVWKKSYVDKLQGLFQWWLDAGDGYKLAEGKDAAGAEIEAALSEFIRQGREQGALRPGLSEEAILAYLRFFQQGVASPEVQEKMRTEAKFARDLRALFIYGLLGKESASKAAAGR